jgi:hypothetical protein
MKNVLRVFLLIALAFLANELLFTDFEFANNKTEQTAIITSAE